MAWMGAVCAVTLSSHLGLRGALPGAAREVMFHTRRVLSWEADTTRPSSRRTREETGSAWPIMVISHFISRSRTLHTLSVWSMLALTTTPRAGTYSMERMPPRWPVSVASQRLSLRFHTLMVLSEEPDTRRPSGRRRSEKMESVCPFSVAVHTALLMSHTRMAQS